MKKTTKRYVISTSAVNCYGYRVLTEGIDYSQYEKNPILLWMHQRAYGNDKNQILPLGRAIEFKTDGDALSCALEFDENDAFAMQIYNKYENGTLNMLSLGAKPVEISEETSMMLAGQYGPTFTKCKMTDVSCVDFGGNDDACACQLYDADDKKIELSKLSYDGLIQLYQSLQPKKDDNDSMKLIQLTGAALQGILLTLKLKDDANEADVQKSVADLVQLSADQGTQIIALTNAKTEAETKKTEAENKLAANIKLAGEKAITETVDKYAERFLPAERDNYITLASANLEATEKVLQSLPKAETVNEKVNGKKKVDEAINLSWDALDKSGALIKLKAENFEVFKTKYFDKFGKEYTGDK